MTTEANKSKKRGSSWLLWWQIDEDELNRQAHDYSSISFWKSGRGGAVFCLVISIVMTSAMAYFGWMGANLYSFIDVGLMAVLAVFIAFGHRWAIVLAMVYWTFSKLMGIVDVVQSNSGSSVGAFTSVIWWAIYMHAFYFAFRVEQRRRKPLPNPEVFS